VGAKNLKAFNRGLDKFAKRIDAKALLFQKKVAFMVLGAFLEIPGAGIRAHSGVIQFTPVDTGRAVGNWQVSIGAPATGEVPNTFGAGGSGKASAQAFAAKNGVQGMAGLKVGQSIWICNNLPYIVVLNDGGVNRTAHHMVERALANTRRALRSGGR
jgi:hypothetical protein